MAESLKQSAHRGAGVSDASRLTGRTRPWLLFFEILVPALGLMAYNWDWWAWVTGLPGYDLWPIHQSQSDWRAVAAYLLAPRQVLRYSCLALLVIAVSVSLWRIRDSLAEMGLRPSQWRGGWGSMVMFTGWSLALLGGLSLWFGPDALWPPRWIWLIRYVPGMILQQWALQCYFNNRLYMLGEGTPDPRRRWLAIVGSTAVFAAMHTPNYGLVLLVLLAGGFWTWHYRRHRNFVALCASHLVLGMMAMMLLGNGPLCRLRVGLPALDWIMYPLKR